MRCAQFLTGMYSAREVLASILDTVNSIRQKGSSVREISKCPRAPYSQSLIITVLSHFQFHYWHKLNLPKPMPTWKESFNQNVTKSSFVDSTFQRMF